MKKIKTILITIVVLWLIAFLLSKSITLFSENKIVSDGIAVIEIHGPITIQGSNSFMQYSTSSTRIIEDIKKAEKNSGIKAIILDINSGGGGPVASREISQAVKKAKKPTIAWIREVGASGAYWVASSTDVIIADPLSITGSIGVFGSYLDFSGFLEKYDIKYEKLTAGKYKDTGTPFRELTTQEKNLLQQKLNLIQEIFIKEIADNRNLTQAQVNEIRTAFFYLGKEALQLNLIDYLGGKDLAVQKAKELAGMEDGNIVEYKEKKSILDLLERFSSEVFYAMGKGIGSEIKLESDMEITT